MQVSNQQLQKSMNLRSDMNKKMAPKVNIPLRRQPSMTRSNVVELLKMKIMKMKRSIISVYILCFVNTLIMIMIIVFIIFIVFGKMIEKVMLILMDVKNVRDKSFVNVLV